MNLVGRRRRTAAAVVLALFVTGACSSPQGTEAENSLLGADKKPRGQAEGGGAKKKPDGAKGGGGGGQTGGPQVTPPPAEPELGMPGENEAPPTNSGAAKTETKVTSTGTDPRTASVLVTEPDPDAEKSGLPPDFADILSTRVEGGAKSVRFTLTFRGNLPTKMPDDKTYMVAGVGLTGPNGGHGYAFGASADTKGWNPYGGNKDTDGKFPGTMSIQGDTIVFTLPWSAIDGPRAFKWYSQQTWFKSIAGTTHYSLDNVPNEGPAKYPAD